ncbi:MAG: hypothetical protein NPINA01_28070 [Nitrospinaceae bacterium]|nr:MAG: hypothetical protein NPINA01_28070 [Nitrospinaceae bacterium]
MGSTIQHQQRAEVQVRAPENLHLESTALHQPTMPVYANYFSSPLKSANLFKEAAIPSGFSEETLKSGNEDQEASAKIANLSVGIDVISEEGLKKIKNGFSTQVRTKIAKVKYYPRIARNRGFEGQPVIAFTLGSKGELLDLSIAAPSPFKLLDEAALNAIKSASPYPPIPAPLKLKSMKFKIPISFNLEER